MTLKRGVLISPDDRRAQRRGLGRTLPAGAFAAAGLATSLVASAALADPTSAGGWLVWLTQQSLRSRDDALLLLGLVGLAGGAIAVIVLATAQLISLGRTRVDPPQGPQLASGFSSAPDRRTGSARRKT